MWSESPGPICQPKHPYALQCFSLQYEMVYVIFWSVEMVGWRFISYIIFYKSHYLQTYISLFYKHVI